MTNIRPADAGQAATTPVRVCAVLTCFNRRAKTLECLRALATSAGLAQLQLHAVLVDDGSTDGTEAAVRAEFDCVEVLRGDGALFWCRGMHRGIAHALTQQHELYLWLNDDTVLQPDALTRLLACEAALRGRHGRAPLLVGSTVDASSGALSYGGSRRHSVWLPMRFVPLVPTAEPQRCDAMTGNIVLMAREVLARVGNLDPRFEHAMGDTDYALRAARIGVQVWLAPGVHGTCSDNPGAGTYRDRVLPLHERWRRMLSRKGLPWRSWLILTRAHAGLLWPLHFAWPYVRLVGGALATRQPRDQVRT